MRISLNQIFEKQATLDQQVHSLHNVTYNLVADELKLALIVELAELANEIRSFKFWSNKAASDKKIILEEYVDSIHFITALAIYNNAITSFEYNDEICVFTSKTQITKAFLSLFEQASKMDVNNKTSVQEWYYNFLEFGFKLGYSFKDIIDSYNLKNLKNHDRQKNNY